MLIARDGAVVWADASTSAAAMPDSRSRWEAIWRQRDELEEIVHSHPNGPSSFSNEDETTMQALRSALGRELRFSIVTPKATIARVGTETLEVDPEPWWADLLRLASGMKQEE
jgi:hypothetical protein